MALSYYETVANDIVTDIRTILAAADNPTSQKLECTGWLMDRYVEFLIKDVYWTCQAYSQVGQVTPRDYDSRVNTESFLEWTDEHYVVNCVLSVRYKGKAIFSTDFLGKRESIKDKLRDALVTTFVAVVEPADKLQYLDFFCFCYRRFHYADAEYILMGPLKKEQAPSNSILVKHFRDGKLMPTMDRLITMAELCFEGTDEDVEQSPDMALLRQVANSPEHPLYFKVGDEKERIYIDEWSKVPATDEVRLAQLVLDNPNVDVEVVDEFGNCLIDYEDMYFQSYPTYGCYYKRLMFLRDSATNLPEGFDLALISYDPS